VVSHRRQVVYGQLRLGGRGGRGAGVGGGEEVANGDGVLRRGALESFRTLKRVGRRELAGGTADPEH